MNTLSDVWRESKAHLGFRCLLKMDQTFFHYIHNRPNIRELPAGRQFADLSHHFARVAQLDQISQRDPCTSPIAWARKLVINGDEPGFMGPLCCPMTKTEAIRTISQEKDAYWVTEKSDGIRVVFCSFLAQEFPRWQIIWHDPVLKSTRRQNVSLVDNIMLEGGFSELLQSSSAAGVESAPAPTTKESSQLRLSFGTHSMRRGPPSLPSNLLELVLRNDQEASQDSLQVVTVVRDVTPRHFSYVFDRSVDNSYLLLEEYPFLNLAAVALDAELVVADAQVTSEAATSTAVIKKRMFLATFDCFATQDRNAALSSGAPNSFDQAILSTEFAHLLQRAPVSERIDVMKSSVFSYMQHTGDGRPFLPLTVPVILKRMVKVDDMASEFFPHLHRVAGGAMRYSGYGALGATANDGFIFTPEHFDIISGSQPKQLKWKWPEMLTVDWKVAAVPSSAAAAAGRHDDVACQVSLHFKKKRADGNHSAGHAQYSRSCILSNPNHVAIPTGTITPYKQRVVESLEEAPGVVVECRLDRRRGMWIMEKARREKREANSVVTAISVLEGIAEDFDLGTLCSLLDVPSTQSVEISTQICRLRGDGALSAADEACDKRGGVLPPPKPPTPCKVLLRAVTRRFDSRIDLVVQWVVKLPSLKNVIPCNHRSVDACFGLGEPAFEVSPSSRLREKLLLSMANAGGCHAWSNVVCDACFDGATGRWGITKVYPDLSSNSCFFTGVMDHLTSVAKYHAYHGVFPTIADMGGSDAQLSPIPFPLSLPNAETLQVGTNAHYADRARVLSSNAGGGPSQRSNIRRMNNFIKAVLLQSGFGLLRSAAATGRGPSASDGISSEHRFTVADVCCGRGGDLQKWKRLPVSLLLMVDSCYEAVAEAASRYCVGAGLSTRITEGKEGFPGIPARFFVRDCFEHPHFAEMLQSLRDDHFACTVGGCDKAAPAASPEAATLRLMPPSAALQQSDGGFDLVSCQFSMHYGFIDESHVRAFLQNVSSMLRKGGIFVGTTVDDRVLLKRREMSGRNEFGNELYKIQFEQPDNKIGERGAANEATNHSGPYGEAYAFTVENCVESQVEYVVHWHPFVALASSEFGLSLLETSNFSEVYNDFVHTDLGQRILQSVIRESGGDASNKAEGEGAGTKRTSEDISTMNLSDEEKDVCFLYRSFIFRKD